MTELLTNTECILRGGQDRPARLYVDSFDAETVALKPVAAVYDRPLSFRRERVYALDQELLKEMGKCSDRQSLERLWERGRLWQPSEAIGLSEEETTNNPQRGN